MSYKSSLYFMIHVKIMYAFLISSLHAEYSYFIIFYLAVQIKPFAVSSFFQPPVFSPLRPKFYPRSNLLEISVSFYFSFNRFFTFR